MTTSLAPSPPEGPAYEVTTKTTVLRFKNCQRLRVTTIFYIWISRRLSSLLGFQSKEKNYC